jgi:hypothetical protein
MERKMKSSLLRPATYWLGVFIFMLLTAGIAKASLPVIMEETDIPPYLVKMIAWHKLAASLEVSPDLPREVLLKEQLQQHADKALTSSFEFAHDLAGIVETTPKPAADNGAPAQTPAKGRNIFKTIAGIEQQISALKSSLASARTAQARSQCNGKLQLAEEDLVLFKSIAENLDTSDEENNNLDQKISKLEATVPELNGQQQKAAPPVLPEQNASGSSGIFGLLTEIYNDLQAKAEIKSLIGNTTDIRTDSRKYSLAARDGVKDILRQGDSIGQPAAKNTANNTVNTPAAPPVTYDGLLTDMKKLTKVTIAASGVGLSLRDCLQDLTEWNDMLSQHVRDLSSRIFFRLCTLLLTIGGALCVSILIGKALPRYVPDERRLNQLHTIKKIILSIIIGLIIFLGFFTDLSSLGTFVGLLTAGLAVALQNVILSMIAYFQFFGSFGLKNGDRITISGVTGKVMKIGMLRFYLMEMKESDLGYLPTGRAVGFSNSILFQPMPFFRQTPGTNFVWNEIMLTLDPTIDHQDAYKKIHAAVERIYAKHLTAMQKQQTSLQKLAQFKAEVSVPQIYLKITGTGLMLVIRYAVEREQASTLHLQLTEELLAVIKKDPVLKIVNIG